MSKKVKKKAKILFIVSSIVAVLSLAALLLIVPGNNKLTLGMKLSPSNSTAFIPILIGFFITGCVISITSLIYIIIRKENIPIPRKFPEK